jgi:hypothetical protein
MTSIPSCLQSVAEARQEPPERRLHERFKIALQIELRPEGTDFPIHLQTTDVSCGGCYLEMAFTLEPGRNLDLILWLGGQKLLLKGVVVSSHPQFGNGIEFTGMAEDQRYRLEQFLSWNAAEKKTLRQ